MGEMQVALWRGSSRDGDDWYTPCPCAPPYNNSDPRAVTLTVKFDSYSYPVYYPATIPQSWTSLLGMDEGNTALRKQFHRLLDLIKEGKLHGVSHTPLLHEQGLATGFILCSHPATSPHRLCRCT